MLQFTSLLGVTKYSDRGCDPQRGERRNYHTFTCRLHSTTLKKEIGRVNINRVLEAYRSMHHPLGGPARDGQ